MKSSTQDVRYLSDKCAALETRLAEIEELDYHLRKRIAALEGALRKCVRALDMEGVLDPDNIEPDSLMAEIDAALKGDADDRD